MPRKRSKEHGRVHNGRFEFDDSARDIIRAYTTYKLAQAKRSLASAQRAHQRIRNQQSGGRVAYYEHIVEFLETLSSSGQSTVDAGEWDIAWTHTTVDRRYDPSARADQPALPGMEG